MLDKKGNVVKLRNKRDRINLRQIQLVFSKIFKAKSGKKANNFNY